MGGLAECFFFFLMPLLQLWHRIGHRQSLPRPALGKRDPWGLEWSDGNEWLSQAQSLPGKPHVLSVAGCGRINGPLQGSNGSIIPFASLGSAAWEVSRALGDAINEALLWGSVIGEGPFYRHQGCPASLRESQKPGTGHGKQIHIVYISVISVFGGLKEMILNLFLGHRPHWEFKNCTYVCSLICRLGFFFFCQAWGGCYDSLSLFMAPLENSWTDTGPSPSGWFLFVLLMYLFSNLLNKYLLSTYYVPWRLSLL